MRPFSVLLAATVFVLALALALSAPAKDTPAGFPAVPAAAPPAAAPAEVAAPLGAPEAGILLRWKVHREARRAALAYVLANKSAVSEADLEAYVLTTLRDKAAAGEIKVESEADWKTFFEALADFMEKVVPLILQIVDIFTP